MPTRDANTAAIDVELFRLQEQAPTLNERDDDAGGADDEEELAALAVDEHHADDGHQKVDDGEDDIAPVRAQVGEAALQENVGVVADDRVDAGGRVAEEDDAGEQKGNDVFAAQQGALPFLPATAFLRRGRLLPSPATRPRPGLWSGSAGGRRGRSSFLPRRKSQRGDSETKRLPRTKRMPGGSETQNMRRQA